MKKTIIAILAFLACGSASANGFYVGLGAGALDLQSDTTHTLTLDISAHDSPFPQTQSQHSGEIGLNTTMVAGYSWDLVKHFVVSLEAFGNLPSAKLSNNSGWTMAQLEDTLDFNSVYGLRLLPGYQVTPEVELYGILGYARADASITDAITAFSGSTSIASYSYSEQFNGYQLGLGSKVNLSQHLALRGDMIYTSYSSKTLSSSFTFQGDPYTDTLTVQPSTLEANVVLLYQFG